MLILLALGAGLLLGAALHVAAPGRELRGRWLSALIGGATAALIFALFVLVDAVSVWAWLVSLVGSLLLTFTITVLVTRARAAREVGDAGGPRSS